MLKLETKRLTVLCEAWENKLKKNSENMPEIFQGEIRCVIGQGRLVMAERFAQFSGLIDNCEFKQGEKETTRMDLKGFWEMIYFQVEDIDNKFARMEQIETNKWIELIVEQPVVKQNKSERGTKRRPVRIKSEASAGLKALIAAKRNKPAKTEIEHSTKQGSSRNNEITREMPLVSINIDTCSDEFGLVSPEKTFDGGFFSIKSPSRHVVLSPSKASQSTGCDKLRKSVLTDSAKRMSGLVSPFVSQVARRALGDKSPEKDSRRSSLFDEFEEESDEDINNYPLVKEVVQNIE